MNNKFVVGTKIVLGDFFLTEKDIIDFGKAFDPLDFHIDIEKAKKTIFKGLIASGPHIFNHVYRKAWLPLYGNTIVCGMGVYNWKFIKPIYANQLIKAEVTILSTREEQHLGGIAVMWQFEFKDEKNEMVQILQTEVMHKIS